MGTAAERAAIGNGPCCDAVVRRAVLTDQGTAHGHLQVAARAGRLRVGRKTIRRDLRALELRGRMGCIYRSAVLQRSSTSADRAPAERVRLDLHEKTEIARLAQGQLAAARAVFLDTSTTVLGLARQFLGRPDLTPAGRRPQPAWVSLRYLVGHIAPQLPGQAQLRRDGGAAAP